MAAYDLSWDQAVYDTSGASTTAPLTYAQAVPTGGALGSADTPSFSPMRTEIPPAQSAGDPWVQSDPWLLAQRDLQSLQQPQPHSYQTSQAATADPYEAQRQQVHAQHIAAIRQAEVASAQMQRLTTQQAQLLRPQSQMPNTLIGQTSPLSPAPATPWSGYRPLTESYLPYSNEGVVQHAPAGGQPQTPLGGMDPTASSGPITSGQQPDFGVGPSRSPLYASANTAGTLASTLTSEERIQLDRLLAKRAGGIPSPALGAQSAGFSQPAIAHDVRADAKPYLSEQPFAFTGPGANDANRSIGGTLALRWLQTYHEQLAERRGIETLPGNVAGMPSSYSGAAKHKMSTLRWIECSHETSTMDRVADQLATTD